MLNEVDLQELARGRSIVRGIPRKLVCTESASVALGDSPKVVIPARLDRRLLIIEVDGTAAATIYSIQGTAGARLPANSVSFIDDTKEDSSLRGAASAEFQMAEPGGIAVTIRWSGFSEV